MTTPAPWTRADSCGPRTQGAPSGIYTIRMDATPGDPCAPAGGDAARRASAGWLGTLPARGRGRGSSGSPREAL